MSSFTTITPRNGQITGTVSLSPELGDASCHGGGLKLCLLSVSYQQVTLTDQTNSVSAFVGATFTGSIPPPSKSPPNPGVCFD